MFRPSPYRYNILSLRRMALCSLSVEVAFCQKGVTTIHSIKIIRVVKEKEKERLLFNVGNIYSFLLLCFPCWSYLRRSRLITNFWSKYDVDIIKRIGATIMGRADRDASEAGKVFCLFPVISRRDIRNSREKFSFLGPD